MLDRAARLRLGRRDFVLVVAVAAGGLGVVGNARRIAPGQRRVRRDIGVRPWRCRRAADGTCAFQFFRLARLLRHGSGVYGVGLDLLLVGVEFDVDEDDGFARPDGAVERALQLAALLHRKLGLLLHAVFGQAAIAGARAVVEQVALP